jgi:hypothetical protein
MRNTVTVSQRFPTWAAANEARDRLAGNDGFERYGIDRIDIERFGGEFELVIRTDEFHRDQIEHLLRSSGTMFNPPTERPWAEAGLTSSLWMFGIAAAAGAVLYGLFRWHDQGSGQGRVRSSGRRRDRHWDDPRGEDWRPQRDSVESYQREGLRSHEDGYAI